MSDTRIGWMISLGLALAVIAWAPVFALARDDAPAPSPFRSMNYEAALAAAAESEKPMLVYATAVWCGPCRIMEQTTWVDERVVERLRDSMVAIKLDVDDEPETARNLAVRAMPTMIVLVDGEEFDRKVGLQTAEQMLGWLDGVERGERGVDQLRDRVRARDEDRPGRVDVKARLDLARELARDGAFEEATEEFVWLWRHMIEHAPAMYGVRLSFMLGDIEELIASYPPAHEAFAAERDASEERLRAGDAVMDDLVDWVSLNEALSDEQRTLDWYERVKDDPEAADSINRVSSGLEKIFESRERWMDLGLLYPDPVESARWDISMYEMDKNFAPWENIDAETHERIRNDSRRIAIDSAAKIHNACLAAGREEEAASVARLLLERIDAPESRIALVRWALQMNTIRPEHHTWLEELEDHPDAAELRRAMEGAGASR